MKPRTRLVYRLAAGFYIALFAALVWPIYPHVATIEPRILSMPFSLAYVVAALLLSFGVLTCLFLWERGDEDELDAEPSDDADRFFPSGRDA